MRYLRGLAAIFVNYNRSKRKHINLGDSKMVKADLKGNFFIVDVIFTVVRDCTSLLNIKIANAVTPACLFKIVKLN